MRFSQAFELDKSQIELDFVDIPLNTDIKLYIDPYAISIRNEEWFKECNNLIVDFFQTLINSIKNKEESKAINLLANLQEPNETHLGQSESESDGRGIGLTQAKSLYKALLKSKAVQTGYLSDLSDCTLMIDGIGPDKISDITINIIRQKLIEYTQEQCDLYEIETHKVSMKPFWDLENSRWMTDYHKLPVYNGSPIILSPKLAVRRRLLITSSDYYEHGILNYLQAELLSAGSSLVETLKNGERLTKKKLKEQEEYKQSKAFLYEYTSENPDVLAQYKGRKQEEGTDNISNESIDDAQKIPVPYDFKKLMSAFLSINTGRNDATKYHNLCLDVLNTVFYPYLSMFRKEQQINEGRKRIDIFAVNVAKDGFFKELIDRHQKIIVPYITFECKNYSEDVNNPEFDQIAGRLNKRRGNLGIILCRKIEDKEKLLLKQRDFVRDEDKYILIFEDSDLIKLIEFRQHTNETELNNFLRSKLQEIII